MRAGVRTGSSSGSSLPTEPKNSEPNTLNAADARRHAVERQRFHAGQVGHAVDEEEAREHQADLHREREVEHDGDDEGGQQHRAVGDRVPAQVAEGVPVAHVDRDDDEHGGKCGERNVLRERRRRQHDHEQRNGMDHARDRGAAAGTDVGRRPRDRARRRNAAEERRDDIGDALRHELLVGVVAVVDLRIGDARGQQGLDRAQECDRDRRRDEVAQRRQRDVGPARTPEAAAECRRTGFRWCRRRDAVRRRRSTRAISTTIGLGRRVMTTRLRRIVLRNARSRSGTCPSPPAASVSWWSSASSAWPSVVIALGQSISTARHATETATVTGSTCPILATIVFMRVKNSSGIVISRPRNSLTCESRIRMAMPLVNPMTIETGMKRMSPPILVRPMTSSSSPAPIVHTSEVGHAVLHDDAVDDDDVRARRPADLHPRAAEERDEEARDDRGEDAGLRRDAGGDRKRHRERQGDDADRQARDDVGRKSSRE